MLNFTEVILFLRKRPLMGGEGVGTTTRKTEDFCNMQQTAADLLGMRGLSKSEALASNTQV